MMRSPVSSADHNDPQDARNGETDRSTYVCRLIREQIVPKCLRYPPDAPENMEDPVSEQMVFLGILDEVAPEVYRRVRLRFLAGEMQTDEQIAAAARRLMKQVSFLPRRYAGGRRQRRGSPPPERLATTRPGPPR